jgi:hypothetical protein
MDVRCVKKVKSVSFGAIFQRTALDSHADTLCTGSNMAVLELTGEKVNVTPFSDHYSAVTDIPIATVVTVWEDPPNGELWMLIINEALYFGDKLTDSILCPNQLRAAGIIVQDMPTQFHASSSHSISLPGKKLEIPLQMHGVISYLDTRLPTAEEIEHYRAGQFQSAEQLTEDVLWEPYLDSFAACETALRSTSAVTRASHCTENTGFLQHKAEEIMHP